MLDITFSYSTSLWEEEKGKEDLRIGAALKYLRDGRQKLPFLFPTAQEENLTEQQTLLGSRKEKENIKRGWKGLRSGLILKSPDFVYPLSSPP